MSKNNGGPAFPVNENCFTEVLGRGESPEGMTLRQYYKGAALKGILANPKTDPTKADNVKLWLLANQTIVGLIADSMLAEDAEFEKKP